MAQKTVKSLKNKNISQLVFMTAWVVFAAPALAAAAPGADSADKKAKNESAAQPARGLGEYLSGRFARSHGDGGNAQQYLQKAHTEDPKNLAIAAQLRDSLIQEGKIDEAIKVAQSSYQFSKKEAISNLLLALQAVKKNDFVAAAKFFEGSADETAGQLWLPLVNGWVDVGRGALKKPLTVEGLSATVGSARTVANYHLGLINAAAGFTDAAAENFANAVDEPTNPPARVMNAILQFNSKNKSPKALEKLTQAYLQTHPEYVTDTSEPFVDSPASGVSEVLFTMATIALRAQMPRDTVVYLQLALYAKPEFPIASVMLGSAYEQLKDYEKSNAAFAKVPQGNEYYTQVQQYIAGNLNNMGKTTEALAMLDQMITGDKAADALMTKGDLLRSHKRFAEANDVYTQALAKLPEKHPMRWAVYFALGVCNERLGKWNDAEKNLQKALAINPNQPDVLNYLGYGWLERGEHLDEARGMLEKAVKARPNDPQIVDSMGWALYLSGRHQEAVPYMEKAVELLPGDPEVNSHLGDVYWRVGRKNEAKFQWERALTFNPDAKLEEVLQKKLKDGLPAIKVADKADAKSL
ncbi:MAG: tetratricopeptide repeat protein [Alphaproteobacteria bacterium]|nr:tetratricopeptide repeat protein [Alphaproteobacteria bacterium]